MKIVRTIGLLTAALGVLLVPDAPAQPPAPKAQPTATKTLQTTPKVAQKPAASAGDYLRITRDGAKAKALEVAIVRFAPRKARPKGPTVDLIGAVHVAEQSYYDQLNREFDRYDVVLYEMVAPEGTKPLKGSGASHGGTVSTIQTGMTQMLNLQFQLDAVDYHRKNMVHADLSPEEFHRAMRERGEGMGTIFLRAMGYAMAKQAGDPSGGEDMKLLLALFDKDRATALKRVMAEQMIDMGGVVGAMEGPKGSTLIADRNKRVIEVLRKQINGGKRRIAIFYGAAHMPDMEKRLQKEFGLVRTSTRWLMAWDLTTSR